MRQDLFSFCASHVALRLGAPAPRQTPATCWCFILALSPAFLDCCREIESRFNKTFVRDAISCLTANRNRQKMNIMASRSYKLLLMGFVSCWFSISVAFSQPAVPPDPFAATYSFNTTNWLSEDGDAPIAFTNLVSVALWNKNALLLDTTNTLPAFLNYNVVESDFTNIEFDQGGLHCVFITDWATADTNQNGTGPGETCYLVAAGDWSSGSPDGFWALYIDPGGTNIYFGGVSNSTTNIFVSAPISWPSNSIHSIAAMYSITNSVLYLDGQTAATGGPVTIVPATNIWTNGFFVGSDNSGYEQARGVFSTLEFFNSNCFNSDWSEFFTNGFIFTNNWMRLTNAYYTWLGGSGGFGPDYGGGGGYSLPPTPTNSVNTNYSAYSDFLALGDEQPDPSLCYRGEHATSGFISDGV
jgi:hypothetical protein